MGQDAHNKEGGPPEPGGATPTPESAIALQSGGSSFWVPLTDFSLSTNGEDEGAPGAGSTSEGLPEYHQPAVGRRVGKYILVTKLGSGRQSVVWRAVQVEPKVRVVALKVYTPDWTPERMELVARARNEVTRGGGLAASVILPVIEHGIIDGHVYYVMPLVDGYPLSHALMRRREALAEPSHRRTGRLFDLPDPDYFQAVASLLSKVARGLGELHAAGVAHCDVKPDNILLDWADRPYLSDFGLARSVEESTDGERTGKAMGTPLYMAREKLLGRRDRDERRCDVYSLGVTLYEAVTLSRPVRIPKDLPRSSWARFLASADPPPPHTRQPHLPPALEAIILKAMSPDPSLRYPSGAQLADALDYFLTTSPAPDSTP